MRSLSITDCLLNELQQSMRTILGGHHLEQTMESLIASEVAPTTHPRPDQDGDWFFERQLSANLLRVNHSGEVAAQALYRGQALSSNNCQLRDQLLQAAEEEIQHLLWCEQRINELGSRDSRLTTVWYLGSFVIGVVVGAMMPARALGFVEETEIQVARHLEDHLRRLPEQDWKTAIILTRMRADEQSHANWARDNGAQRPGVVGKRLMVLCARVMTSTSYYL